MWLARKGLISFICIELALEKKCLIQDCNLEAAASGRDVCAQCSRRACQEYRSEVSPAQHAQVHCSAREQGSKLVLGGLIALMLLCVGAMAVWTVLSQKGISVLCYHIALQLQKEQCPG